MLMNVGKFNFGGFFGAIVCAAGAAAIIYLLANQHFPLKAIKVVAFAAFGGAALGNWIWRLATPGLPEELKWDQPLDGGRSGV